MRSQSANDAYNIFMNSYIELYEIALPLQTMKILQKKKPKNHG